MSIYMYISPQTIVVVVYRYYREVICTSDVPNMIPVYPAPDKKKVHANPEVQGYVSLNTVSPSPSSTHAIPLLKQCPDCTWR